MIAAFGLLLACQLAGEILVRALALPLPGPVAGMIFLFIGLVARRRLATPDAMPIAENIGRAANILIANLAFLFVPAAVGIVRHAALVRDHALLIGVALLVSTLATLAVTAIVFTLASRIWQSPPTAGEADNDT